MFTFHNFNTSVTFFLLDKYSKIFYIQNEVNMYVLVERSTGKMNEKNYLQVSSSSLKDRQRHILIKLFKS